MENRRGETLRAPAPHISLVWLRAKGSKSRGLVDLEFPRKQMVLSGHRGVDCSRLDFPSRTLARSRTVPEKPRLFSVLGSTRQTQLFPYCYFTVIHTKSSLQKDMVS